MANPLNLNYKRLYLIKKRIEFIFIWVMFIFLIFYNFKKLFLDNIFMDKLTHFFYIKENF